MPDTPTVASTKPPDYFADIGGDKARSVELRAMRRAAAINAVQMAREHGKRANDLFTQADADTIMLITELLDRVTEP
jgi:hypothetical protein